MYNVGKVRALGTVQKLYVASLGSVSIEVSQEHRDSVLNRYFNCRCSSISWHSDWIWRNQFCADKCRVRARDRLEIDLDIDSLIDFIACAICDASC